MHTSTFLVLARPKSDQVVQDESEERRVHDARGTVEEVIIKILRFVCGLERRDLFSPGAAVAAFRRVGVDDALSALSVLARRASSDIPAEMRPETSIGH